MASLWDKKVFCPKVLPSLKEAKEKKFLLDRPKVLTGIFFVFSKNEKKKTSRSDNSPNTLNTNSDENANNETTDTSYAVKFL